MANNDLGVGGCLRDDLGRWILGYSKYIGNGSVLQAELLAIFVGLDLAYQANMNSKIEVETDSSQAVKLLLHHTSPTNHPLDSIIANCKYLLSRF